MVCRTVSLVLVLFFLVLQVCAVDPNEKVARRILKSVRRDLGASEGVDRRNLSSVNETDVADDLSEFDGRRNLWSRWDCPNMFELAFPHFGHVGVSVKQPLTPTDPICINSKGQRIWQFSTWSGEPNSIKIAVDVKVVDDDRHCPGCYEQLHVGIIDENNKLYNKQHKCVNPGHGNFGSKQLTFYFEGLKKRRVYKLVLFGGWGWRCPNDNKRTAEHHLSYHARAETVAEMIIW
jgi:hypothetical protein